MSTPQAAIVSRPARIPRIDNVSWAGNVPTASGGCFGEPIPVGRTQLDSCAMARGHVSHTRKNGRTASSVRVCGITSPFHCMQCQGSRAYRNRYSARRPRAHRRSPARDHGPRIRPPPGSADPFVAGHHRCRAWRCVCRWRRTGNRGWVLLHEDAEAVAERLQGWAAEGAAEKCAS